MESSAPPFVMPELVPEEADVLLATATDIEWQMTVDVWRDVVHDAAEPRAVPGSDDYLYLRALGGNHMVLA